MSNRPIQVNSEIGKLKTVVVHRPGNELANLMPDYLDRLLFDDIPYLEEAQAEHDAFVKAMEDFGTEVLYLEELVAEALDHADKREEFVDEWISEAGIASQAAEAAVREQLLELETFDLVLKTMAGFRKSEISLDEQVSLSDRLETEYPFLVDPMPNLYFTRDPFATMEHGISLNRMYADTRNRETIYGKYIFEYHPTYGDGAVPKYYERDWAHRIEGGDELVLSKDVLCIGISQRTDSRAIEELARNVFEETEFKEVLGVRIDSNRKFMHLDTVFTMIDYDKFTVHPEIMGGLKVFSLTKGEDGEIHIEERVDELDVILADALGIDEVTLIPCAGGDIVDSAREQWNDGSNTLTVAPGVVVVYDRNTITNKLLEEHGLELIKVKGGELVRGRGGPRCMTMPLVREDVDFN